MSWRDHKTIHPAAAVFPALPDDELRKLAHDIDRHGLRAAIQTRTVAGPNGGVEFVIDGVNRLDAMESLGWQIINEKGEWIGELATVPGTKSKVEHFVGRTHAQVAAEVIGFNIQRRHLSKQEQVELIDAVLRAATIESANIARSFSPVPGKKGGSTKGHTGRVVEESKKLGISERTAKLALVKALKRRKPIAKCPRRRSTPPEFGSDQWRHDAIKRFKRFLDHWPVTQHRELKKVFRDFLVEV